MILTNDQHVVSLRRFRAYQVVSAFVDVLQALAVVMGIALVGWSIWVAVQLHVGFDHIAHQTDRITAHSNQVTEAMRSQTALPAPLELAPVPDVPALPFGLTISEFFVGVGVYAAFFTGAVLAAAVLEVEFDREAKP